ncbi:MAG: hypothetical protein H6626_07960 [Pseudobdellovibrionaceae bacterium]|nr:hypothetical protein [Bdellovibrionales bacterium]USN46159.1 MAG: hypothetical protein H6626_07960 [Pseudobdellovibrionaceae bacterium]
MAECECQNQRTLFAKKDKASCFAITRFILLSFFLGLVSCQLADNRIRGQIANTSGPNSEPPGFSCAVNIDASDPQSFGQGTEQLPFVLCGAGQLAALSDPGNSHLWDKYFQLQGDLAMTGPISPIGNSITPFSGVLDGNGHTISGINITSSGSHGIGLFGYTDGAVIKNITLQNSMIDAQGQDWAGVLIGKATQTKISNVTVESGIVTGTGSYYGGIVGDFRGELKDSTVDASSQVNGNTTVGGAVGSIYDAATCSRTSEERAIINNVQTHNDVVAVGNVAGGLVGQMNSAWGYGCLFVVTNSSASGAVSGANYIGGLVGYVHNGNISFSHATGDVNATGRAGGLIGEMDDQDAFSIDIYMTYATGNVTGGFRVGGLIGSSTNQNIYFSYATGDVVNTGTGSAGGLIGYQSGPSHRTAYCYATGSVTSTTGGQSGGLIGYLFQGHVFYSYSVSPVITSANYVGGVVGVPGSFWTIDHVFWDKQTNGVNLQCGAGACNDSYGKTTAEMKTASTFNSVDSTNWAFHADSGDDDTDFWELQAGEYPKLSAYTTNFSMYTFAGGTGSQADPFLIANPSQLNQIGPRLVFSNKYFRLTSDINMIADSAGFRPLQYFTGQLDGNNHTISNLTINSPGSSQMGFIGIGAQAYKEEPIIKNISFNGLSVTGLDYVGGVLGQGEGSMVADISLDGVAVAGNNGVGGVCGQCFSISNVTLASGNVTGANFYTGGLAGITGSINFSSYAGVVSGASITGGGVGQLNITSGPFQRLVSSKNLILGTVSGTGNVGGFVGIATRSEVQETESRASVIASLDQAGGLMGSFENGEINDCGATGSVSGTNAVGGLAGNAQSSTVSQSFAAGQVNGSGSNVGGYLGTTSGVNTYAGNFWNKEENPTLFDIGISGDVGDADQISGEMLINLKTESTYTNKGWDFLNIWIIQPGQNGDFPFLR